MDRAFVGDLRQSDPLSLLKVSSDGDQPVDPINAALARFALLTFRGVNLAVSQSDRHAVQGKRLTVGIHAQGHRGACAQGGEQQIVG